MSLRLCGFSSRLNEFWLEGKKSLTKLFKPWQVAMARFNLDEGTSGRKKKKRGTEEEEALKKMRISGRGKWETFELEDDEEKDADEVGDGEEDDGEREENEGGSFRGVINDGEFNFRIDPHILYCSICLNPLRPPIFQCRNGHIACSSCCPKLSNKCYVCSQSIGRQRCRPLEKVLESIKCQCQYANYGCRATLSFYEKHSHEETCKHAALFCPIRDCTFCGSKQLLETHFKRKHCNLLKNFSYDQPFMISLERQQPVTILLGEDSHLFLLLNRHATRFGNVLSVICMGSNTPESEFSYELRVLSRGSSLQLRTSAEKVKQWNGVYPTKAFLVVPDDFSTSNVEIYANVCIQKSSGILS